MKKMDTEDRNLPKLIGIIKAAEMLNVHPATLRRWHRNKKLIPVIVSKRGDRRYRLEDIEKFIDDSLKQF
jgi:DNA-binding transcriptional MerR regulator